MMYPDLKCHPQHVMRVQPTDILTMQSEQEDELQFHGSNSIHDQHGIVWPRMGRLSQQEFIDTTHKY